MTTPIQHIEVERRIIHLMLRYRDVIEEMVGSGLDAKFFDSMHQPLVQSIYSEYLQSDHKRLLTRDHYRDTLNVQKNQKGLHLAMTVFDKCYIGVSATPDDLGLLRKQLTDLYLDRCGHQFLESFRDEKKRGTVFAAQRLVERFQNALSPITTAKHTDFNFVSELREGYLSRFEKLIESPDNRVVCGIPEIDEPMNVGFRPGHLTLFAADVGGHKSNLMMNIALQLYEKYNQSILFIPLEMSSDDLMNRVISNRTGIPFSKITQPSRKNHDGTIHRNITNEEIQRIKDAAIWIERSQKFAILDVSERTSVSVVKAEIEKRIHFFKPQIVVVDYIALMSSDKNFGGRNDLEIGDILKSLRFLGRRYGFHIMSAAQIGRAALSKMRQDGFASVQLDSTSLRGSHEYSADADSIFALYLVPDEDDKLKIFTIKARHGRAGQTQELRLKTECYQIFSTKDTSLLEEGVDIQDMVTNLNQTPEKAAEELKQQEQTKSMKWAGSLDDLDIG